MSFEAFNKDTFKVYIIAIQRNGRKYITQVIDMPDKYDFPKILKYIKKVYNCNGTIIKQDDGKEILQFSGDQRHNIYDFFIKYNVMDKENISVKGF